MKVSRKTDYALRVLVTLAGEAPETVLSIRRLAERNDVPRRFLEQIMIELRAQGWVRAVAGRDGGYALAIAPKSLTMGRIVRHFDGVLAPIGCVSVTQREPCSQEKNCRFRRVFLAARNHVAGMLDRLTLADLAKGDFTTADVPVEPVRGEGKGI